MASPKVHSEDLKYFLVLKPKTRVMSTLMCKKCIDPLDDVSFLFIQFVHTKVVITLNLGL